MDNAWLKSQIDKLRAEASRGPVPGVTVFTLTDPIMDRLARSAGSAQMDEKLVEKVAQEICREECAAFGDPPCWKIGCDVATCEDDPGCVSLARAVIPIVLEEAAKVLDDNAQFHNRIRDPGMANHDRALARRIQAMGGEEPARQEQDR